MARLFYYLIEHYGRKTTLRVMQQVSTFLHINVIAALTSLENA